MLSRNPRITLALSSVLAVLAYTALPTMGYAQTPNFHHECNLSGFAGGGVEGCPNHFQGNTYTTTTAVIGDGTCTGMGSYCSVRSEGNAIAPIDAWGLCRWVNNSSTKIITVPFKTNDEWLQFNDTLRQFPEISTAHCSLPFAATNAPSTLNVEAPYPSCLNLTLQTPNVYGRAHVSRWPEPALHQSFTCNKGATTIQAWMQWFAGDADEAKDGDLNWTLQSSFSPNVTLTATDDTNSGNTGTTIKVNSGTLVTLTWKTNGKDEQTWSCKASGDWSGLKVHTTGAESNGSQDVIVYDNSTFILTCTDNNGLSSIATATVNAASACGADAGKTLSSPPTDLCFAEDTLGNFHFKEKTATWSWTCSPYGTGHPQPCSATLCQPKWATTNTELCSASCGDGTQSLRQIDDCGNTRTIQEPCHVRDCE